jgi:hypothetical protein
LSDRCVIRADYTNWRPVAGRKVLQLTLEVPIEQTEEVMERLGVPMPGESKWVAVALLKNGACANERSDGPQENAQNLSGTIEAREGQSGDSPAPTNVPSATGGTSPNPRSFSSLPLPQQAGIRCADVQFQSFLEVKSEEGAIKKVYELCGVESRSQIGILPLSGNIWLDLERQYQAYRTSLMFAGSAW